MSGQIIQVTGDR